MLLYRCMIEATYLYHRDSDSQLASPHSYVPDPTDHQSWRYSIHENAMGPMYQISIVFSLTLRQPLLYHQLYMVGSCISEHKSNYYFGIVMSMGMPALSIYMSHIICISPIDGNHINTKRKSHHALAPEAPPHHSKSYDVHRPYIELLPSHIKEQSINQKNPSLSSPWPTPPKDTTSRPSIRCPHPQKWLRMIKRG